MVGWLVGWLIVGAAVIATPRVHHWSAAPVKMALASATAAIGNFVSTPN